MIQEFYDDGEEADLRAESAAQKRKIHAYHRDLMAHPDPRDPDYPGDDEPEEND